MTLEKYIKTLTNMIALDGNQPWAVGLGDPNSYRGGYAELAFDVVRDTTTQAMLDCARECVGKMFTGWKGGNFTMRLETLCWIDKCGKWNRIPLSNKALRLLALIEPEPGAGEQG